MPAPRIPRTVPQGVREPRDGMSRAHLEDVRQCDCLLCGAPGPNDPHHLLRADPTRGMGRKAADRYTIPACRACHDRMHEHGDDEEVLAQLGIDGRAVASALWRQDTLVAKQRAIFRARQFARAA